MNRLLCFSFVLFCLPFFVRSETPDDKSTPSEWAGYLDKLGRAGRFDELKRIASSKGRYHFLAASALIKFLPTREALAYCDQLEFGLSNWQAAFLSLDYHPKEKVISYLTKVHSKGALGKAFCYDFCRMQRWPEFAKQAQMDMLEYSDLIIFPNDNIASVAEYANKYLSALATEEN
jgi:hypothetical protein